MDDPLIVKIRIKRIIVTYEDKIYKLNKALKIIESFYDSKGNYISNTDLVDTAYEFFSLVNAEYEETNF